MDIELQDLFATALVSGLKEEDVKNLSKVYKEAHVKYRKKPIDYRYVAYIIGLISFLIILGQPSKAYREPIQHITDFIAERIYDKESDCLLSHSAISLEVSRPLEKCGICQGITEVRVDYIFFLFSMHIYVCLYICQMKQKMTYF